MIHHAAHVPCAPRIPSAHISHLTGCPPTAGLGRPTAGATLAPTATTVAPQLAPQQPAGRMNAFERLMTSRTKTAPKVVTERRDATTFLVAPVGAAATNPVAAGAAAAASPVAAGGAAVASPATAGDTQGGGVAGGAGFAPNEVMLTVDVNSLGKNEAIDFCRLLHISYQGDKAELKTRIFDEIKRRHELFKTNPLEGPVFQAVLAEFGRQRKQVSCSIVSLLYKSPRPHPFTRPHRRLDTSP